MRPLRRRYGGGFSDELKELAHRILEADGIKPLGPGERRPPDYYAFGWLSWGKKPLPPAKPRDDKR